MDWQGTLLAIITSGGVGGFLDFWIGMAGQKRVRSCLETWWLRFSYVRLDSFGREEASFAIEVMDRLVGSRLLSARRFQSTAVITACNILLFLILAFLTNHSLEKYSTLPELPFVTFFAFSIVLLWISFSLTRAVAVIVVRACGDSRIRNLLLFAISFLMSYCLFHYSPKIATHFTRSLGLLLSGGFAYNDGQPNGIVPELERAISFFIFEIQIMVATSPPSLIEPFERLRSLLVHGGMNRSSWAAQALLVGEALSFFAGLSRLLLAAIFVLSFAARPLYQPLSLLAAKVIESDKPIFGIIFAGIAGLAKGIQWLVEHI